ncbi:MAG: Gfo/Idh/MocA family protein [Lysobacterales bacterium]
MAFMGLGGRGQILLADFLRAGNVTVTDLCDADARRMEESNAILAELGAPAAAVHSDIRKVLDHPNSDVLVIATPDHWHAPAALIALQAGKHVYLEKPVSHNPAEGELLVAAVARYGKVLQVGNQQRSSPESIELRQRVENGDLGDIYQIDNWYANARESIGNGVISEPPPWLDWEQWQGPAPRREFQDNLVHYNWHWFWHWGTGETCNNAMHELDIARWMLAASYPDEVCVRASRQFYREDDWEMYDTMVAEYRFGDVTVTWEGHSCNKVSKLGSDRGTLIYGTGGSAQVDRNGYRIFDPAGELLHESLAAEKSATTDTRGGGVLNDLHVANFLGTVRGTADYQHSPIEEGHRSTLMCHLANIAYRTGETLSCNPQTGRPRNAAAQALWSREYAPGWEFSL